MNHLIEFSALILGTISALLPIANPFSTAPVFASLTGYMTPQERNAQARLSAMYMVGVLLVTLFLGAMILSFFGITIPAVRIAGGILIAKIGLSMVSSDSQNQISEKDKSESFVKQDIAFVPIAMPLLSGPGSMAVTLGMASHADNSYEYVGIGSGIVIVALISWLILRFANQVAKFLGATGLNALTKVMGFLLLSVGVTFIFQGIFEGITNPEIMGPIVRTIQQI
jgi:multiple antibiotic resistance protein